MFAGDSAVREQAEKEIAEEEFRRKVEERKAFLRNRKPFWHKLFPFTIKITRR